MRSQAFEARIRANRLRMVFVTAIALANLWLLVTLIGFVALAGRIGPLTAQPSLLLFVIAGAGLISVALVWQRLVSAPQRTLHTLETRPLTVDDSRVVSDLLAELAIAMGIPVPRARHVDDPAPNAIAVGNGPRNTVVVVTSGLVDTFPRNELEAVLADVVCSIALRDVALGTVASACIGETIKLASTMEVDSRGHVNRLGQVIGALPRAATAPICQSIARSRSTSADIFAIETTRNPVALLRALERFEASGAPARHWEAADPQMWFVSPVPADWAPGLPTITDRRLAIELAFDVRSSRQ